MNLRLKAHCAGGLLEGPASDVQWVNVLLS
jgi:hypothetical protein